MSESSSERLMAEYRHNEFLKRQGKRDELLAILNEALSELDGIMNNGNLVDEGDVKPANGSEIFERLLADDFLPEPVKITETDRIIKELKSKSHEEIRALVLSTIEQLKNMSRYAAW